MILQRKKPVLFLGNHECMETDGINTIEPSLNSHVLWVILYDVTRIFSREKKSGKFSRKILRMKYSHNLYFFEVFRP